MKVVRRTDSQAVAANNPLFEGGAVHLRGMIDAQTSPAVTVNLVRFSDGARTKPHTHTADQILYITEGHGVVGTRSDSWEVHTGDIVHIPAGEVHFHGAAPAKDMAHLSILPPSQMQIVEG
jgi:quercetin dioxygenase-like cupin family protein